MGQGRNGHGALPLLLRLSMLRARQRGQGTLADRGYALAVALIAAFVLLLGVGALASRGQLGFVGQVFQAQNREARDVAESAIAAFADTMNQVENRRLLIAGDASDAVWNASTNVCTAIDASGNLVVGSEDLRTAETDDFLPTGSSEDYTNLDGDVNRQFRVESIDYLIPDPANSNNRIAFTSADTGLIENLERGTSRTLIRVTMIGRVPRGNGRFSTARVAREFEVVPKCCQRSFPQNQFSAVNWGRDNRDCFTPKEGNGLIVGLNGTPPSGSKNEKNIFDESGEKLFEALCSDLGGDPPPDGTCGANDFAIGDPSGTGISFTPIEFEPDFPEYDTSSTVVAQVLQVKGDRYIYLDPAVAGTTNANGIVSSGILIDDLDASGNPDGSPTRLDGADATTATGPDPCYIKTDLDYSSTPPIPYYTIDCRLTSIDFQTGSSKLYVDTSSAQINLFFDDTSIDDDDDYINADGNNAVLRTHLFRDLSANPTTTPLPPQGCLGVGSISNCLITWPDPDPSVENEPITPSDYPGTFLEPCSVTLAGCNGEEYDTSNLLNMYAEGPGNFTFRGTPAGLGFNIYGEDADVEFKGTGDFMGQLWVDYFYLNGDVSINTFSSSKGPAGGGIPFIDFMVRSFTQSSGF